MPEQRASPSPPLHTSGLGSAACLQPVRRTLSQLLPIAGKHKLRCSVRKKKAEAVLTATDWDQRAQCTAKTPRLSRRTTTDAASTGSAPKCASQGCRKAQHAQNALLKETNLGRRTPHRRCTQLHYRGGAGALQLPGRAKSHRPRPPAPQTGQASCSTILQREAFAGHKHIQAAVDARYVARKASNETHERGGLRESGGGMYGAWGMDV